MKAILILDRKTVLEHVSQEEIFEKYLGLRPQYGVSFTNPLRQDKYAGCRFYDKYGRIRFKDFSRGWNWDCFDVIMFDFGCNYNEALKIVATDFNIQTYEIGGFRRKPSSVRLSRRESFSSGNSSIIIKQKKFSRKELTFWGQYGIDEPTLERFRVMSVEKAWLQYPDKYKVEVYSYSYSDICFCYDLGWEIRKLYFPERKEDRFMQVTAKVAEGYVMLPDFGSHLIITKSYKDVIALWLYDLLSIAPASETVIFPEKFMAIVLKSFDQLFTLFDNDKAGKIASIKYRDQYNTTPLLFPSDMEKDFTDNLVSYGNNFMIDYAEDFKQRFL
ncbi:hypothetical protein LCGC14_0246160 [marine sediment metagenome]|uniref:Uncharacterized protein n=1 Tax=marine sediment metagenome TaxID=412755 RepID=A0A0F9U675_9ZZZZ